MTVHETVNYNQRVENKVENNVKPIVEFLEKQLYKFFNEESVVRRGTNRKQLLDLERLDVSAEFRRRIREREYQEYLAQVAQQQETATTQSQNDEESGSENSSERPAPSQTPFKPTPVPAFKDTRIHLCLYCIPSILTPLRAIDLECIRSINHLVPVVPIVARSDSLIQSERQFFKKRIIDELFASSIDVFSGSDIFFLIGSFEQYRDLSWGKIDIEDSGHNDLKKFRRYILEKNLLNLIEHTHDVCYEKFRRKILLNAGFPDNVSIHSTASNQSKDNTNSMTNNNTNTNSTDFIAKMRESFENDKKKLRAKFIDKIKLAENDINTEKESHANRQAKGESQINHNANRLRGCFLLKIFGHDL